MLCSLLTFTSYLSEYIDRRFSTGPIVCLRKTRWLIRFPAEGPIMESNTFK